MTRPYLHVWIKTYLHAISAWAGISPRTSAYGKSERVCIRTTHVPLNPILQPQLHLHNRQVVWAAHASLAQLVSRRLPVLVSSSIVVVRNRLASKHTWMTRNLPTRICSFPNALQNKYYYHCTPSWSYSCCRSRWHFQVIWRCSLFQCSFALMSIVSRKQKCQQHDGNYIYFCSQRWVC